LPDERYRWQAAASIEPDEVVERHRQGAEPWPGALPAPSPTVVFEVPIQVDVVGVSGDAIRVTGRGEITEPPAVLIVDRTQHAVRAWAGPWPIEQRWWSAGRSRRLARFQLVTEDGVAHLVAVEQQRWVILATYA
jgi:protein ImuB